MALTRESLLAIDDRPTEEVFVPEWNDTVFIRAVSIREWDSYQGSIVKIDGTKATPVLADMRSKLVIRCLVDEQGNRLFADNELSILGKLSAKAIDRLYDVCKRLSGMENDDVEAAAENFEPKAARKR